MSPFFKVVVSLIVAVLMGLGFWVMMYQPKQKEISSLDTQIAEQKQKYEEYKVESQNLAQWEQARSEFQAVLQRLHQTGPMKDFIPSFLTDIEKMAKDERASTNDPSFQVTSITPGSVTQEGAGAKGSGAPTPPPGAAPAEKKGAAATSQLQAGKSVIQLNFTGRFSTIVDFLQQLGNFKLNKLVTVQRITLSPQGAVPGLSPTLGVAMPFEVYMLGGGG